MPTLKIDTRKSLYQPVEVEIDGKKFAAKRLDRDIIQQVEALDVEAQGGKLDSAYKQLELLLGKHKAISRLDFHQVGEIITFIVKSMLNPEEQEKNESGPGDVKSP